MNGTTTSDDEPSEDDLAPSIVGRYRIWNARLAAAVDHVQSIDAEPDTALDAALGRANDLLFAAHNEAFEVARLATALIEQPSEQTALDLAQVAELITELPLLDPHAPSLVSHVDIFLSHYELVLARRSDDALTAVAALASMDAPTLLQHDAVCTSANAGEAALDLRDVNMDPVDRSDSRIHNSSDRGGDRGAAGR